MTMPRTQWNTTVVSRRSGTTCSIKNRRQKWRPTASSGDAFAARICRPSPSRASLKAHNREALANQKCLLLSKALAFSGCLKRRTSCVKRRHPIL
jgi:hypothetical protein